MQVTLGSSLYFNKNSLNNMNEMLLERFLDKDFNRTRIIELITNAIGVTVKETIHSIHNFIDFNDMIIRKGAISSYEGQKMVIPFTKEL